MIDLSGGRCQDPHHRCQGSGLGSSHQSATRLLFL